MNSETIQCEHKGKRISIHFDGRRWVALVCDSLFTISFESLEDCLEKTKRFIDNQREV